LPPQTATTTKRDRRIGLHEEPALLEASGQMGGAEHKYVGSAMHDRIIGALELCCRRLGEMLLIQNKRVDWDTHASVQQTQRYLNVTDEELRKGLEVNWKRRTLKAVAGGQNA
jgi:hypothetical protein